MALVTVAGIIVLPTSCSLDWSVPGATDAGAPDGRDDGVWEASADAPPTTWPNQPDSTTVQPGGTCNSSGACDSQNQSVCIFPAFDCGAQSAGSCVALSSDGNVDTTDCTTGGSYCGCDGQLYANSCDPLRKGFDLAPIQTCAPSNDGTQAGYASCPANLVMVEDHSRPHTAVYRCVAATNCNGDCSCLAQLCTQPGGKCSTPTQILCP